MFLPLIKIFRAIILSNYWFCLWLKYFEQLFWAIIGFAPDQNILSNYFEQLLVLPLIRIFWAIILSNYWFCLWLKYFEASSTALASLMLKGQGGCKGRQTSRSIHDSKHLQNLFFFFKRRQFCPTFPGPWEHSVG